MAGAVFAVVLGAAVLHATWNALAKAIPDRWVAAGLLAAAGMVPGAIGAAVLPAPDPAAWPYLGASAVLQTGYLLLLVRAYRYGEFGQVYPLARGLPPLLVTVFSLAVLHERLSGGQLAGVLVVSVALTTLVFSGRSARGSTKVDGGGVVLARPVSPVSAPGHGSRPTAGTAWRGSGLGLAAATGVVIAGYTIVDGIGVRRSGEPLSYAMWLALFMGILVITASRAGYGPGFCLAARRSAPLGLLGGALAFIAYAAVLWAQSQAPLALVSALRETSLLFAGAIGVLFFGERFRVVRVVATAGAVAGIVLIHRLG